MSDSLSALQRVLAADPFAATETLQDRAGYPPSIIELHRYHLAALILKLGEAGMLGSSLRQALPRLRRLVRDWERQVSPAFSHALIIAMGVAKRTGHGADPKPLADYIASTPLTMKELQMHAEFIAMLPASMPRGREHGKTATPRRAATEMAYQLARRVKERQRLWREQNPTQRGRPRQRVPDTVTKCLIEEEKATNPAWRGVDADTVLRHRKTGRL
jgi:hypothetical protein